MGIRAVAVYCGSSSGDDTRYAQAATEVGTTLARRGITVVYGGGSVGLMRRVADAALAAGGRVHGVITRNLADREIAHPGLTELEVVDTMAQRKARMSELSDAFVALPGGSGTLEEIAEQWTWGQIGLHHKPVALLNVNGYYDDLAAFFARAATDGFIRPQYVRMVTVSPSFGEVLEAFERYHAPTEKWARSGDARDMVLRIAALVLNDSHGRTLLVRKRGTTGFMQCGGKLEADETPRQAVVREVHEELGLRIDPERLEHLGRFRAAALNEADTHVDADAYYLSIDEQTASQLRADHEIEELVWAFPEDLISGASGVEVAPLSLETLLPLAQARTPARR